MSQGLERYFLLLNNKLDRVREAESLTLVQYKLIEDRNYDELSENLEKRHKIMQKFVEYSSEIDEMDLENISSDDKKKAQEIEKSIDNIMARIRKDNEKLRAMLVEHSEEYRAEIKKVRDTKKGTMGYMQYSVDSGSRYFDKKS